MARHPPLLEAIAFAAMAGAGIFPILL